MSADQIVSVIVVAKLIRETTEGDNFHCGKFPDPVNWAKARFISARRLLTIDPTISNGFDGLDLFILLAWISKQFASLSRSKEFVLHYWDIRSPNIMVNDQGKIVA